MSSPLMSLLTHWCLVYKDIVCTSFLALEVANLTRNTDDKVNLHFKTLHGEIFVQTFNYPAIGGQRSHFYCYITEGHKI